jgi:hypothetical protein
MISFFLWHPLISFGFQGGNKGKKKSKEKTNQGKPKEAISP